MNWDRLRYRGKASESAFPSEKDGARLSCRASSRKPGERVRIIEGEQFVRVVGLGFSAGFVVRGDVVSDAAPELSGFVGKDRASVRAECERRGWRATIVRKAYDRPAWG
jgi:hypothetical protein